MNNLLKILIPFFIVLGLHADQGMLNTITPSTTDTQNQSGNVDVIVDGSDVYTITSTSLYKYDLTMSSSTNVVLGVGTAKKVTASSNHVFVVSSTKLESFTRAIASEGTYASTKSINSLAVSEDENYVFLGTTTGVVVVDATNPAAMSKVAFVETTNAKDLKVKGDFLYVADDWGGLKVIDISNPEIVSVSSTTSGEYYKLAVENNNIYTIGETGLSSFDISSPAAPVYRGTTTTTANDLTSIFVKDTYAYIGQNNQNPNEFAVYDVSNKINMQEIALSPYIYTVNATSGISDKIYAATSTGIVVLDAISDYDDNATEAYVNQTAKTIQQLSSNEGIFGNLEDSDDIDFIKITLQGGRLDAYISGLDDINVTIYDSNDTTQDPVASVDSSTSDTPKLLNLNTETASGVHYIKIENTDGTTVGEYKITADFTEDDWPDFSASSQIINYNETIKGNIKRADDSDYFRVDLESKGGVIVTSANANVVDFDLVNSLTQEVMEHEGDLSTGKIYKATNSGIYFLRAKAAAEDVENQEYSFELSFSKDLVLDKEDDAPFALKSVSDPLDVVQNVEQIKVLGDTAFIVDNNDSTSSYTLVKANIASIITPISTYVSSSSIRYFEILGDYTYVLTDNSLDVLYTNNLNRRSSYTPQSASNKFKINGDNLFISTDGGSRIELVDISSKDNPTFVTNIEVNTQINDFDIKGSFYEDDTDSTIYGLKTYLYAATDYGLKRFDLEDINNPEELPTFKQDNSFKKIVISNPYAYVESDIADGFSILYIQRPHSTPKLKGSVNWGAGNINSLSVYQDNVYIIGSDNKVNIIDISLQTEPKKLDNIPYMQARSISISNGIGYFLRNSIASPSKYNYLYSYDMSNDYSDVKGGSSEIEYDSINYGVISEFRPDEVDMFYINAERSIDLNISAEGNISITYKLYEFNSDKQLTAFGTNGSFVAGVNETNTTLSLKAGEYYMKLTSTDTNTSGTYQFEATKIEDDYSDSFLYSNLISLVSSEEANMLHVEDKDVVKIELTERGSFDFNTTEGVKVTLLYDDTVTTLSDNTNTINTTLNPGTYYIVMESNGTFAGDYEFESNFASNGELAMPDGFDGIENFNADAVVYGDRYIYVLEPGNYIAVYNHLLQQVARQASADASVDLSNECGKPFFHDSKLFINKSYIEDGMTKCSEYGYISVENTAGNFDYITFGDDIYYKNVTDYAISDRTVVQVDNTYLYEYSTSSKMLYKTLYSEMGLDNYNKRTYGYFSNIEQLNDIKSVKNDENIDLIAVNNTVTIYKTNPNVEVLGTRYVYDNNGNQVTEQYVESYMPVPATPKSFTFSSDIVDMHLDAENDTIYILTDNSNEISIINYNSSDVTLSTKTTVDLGVNSSGMYIRDNKIYLTIEDSAYHGIKVYNYPLNETSVPVNEAQNIGANLSDPFTWDGSTFNYLSNLSPKVYYLSESFVNGQSTGTYSVADSNNIQEGDGGFEGCFIATAAYGSYFEKHVKVLRDFRDNVLLTNSLGKKIVEFYYKHSPSIASKIAMHSGAKNIIRQVLTPIVYIIKYPLIVLGILGLLILGFLARGHIARRKGVLL